MAKRFRGYFNHSCSFTGAKVRRENVKGSKYQTSFKVCHLYLWIHPFRKVIKWPEHFYVMPMSWSNHVKTYLTLKPHEKSTCKSTLLKDSNPRQVSSSLKLGCQVSKITIHLYELTSCTSSLESYINLSYITIFKGTRAFMSPGTWLVRSKNKKLWLHTHTHTSYFKLENKRQAL